VHEPTLLVPLVEPANAYAVADAEWHASGHGEIVRNKHRLAAAQPDHEALVPGAMYVVRNEPHDETGLLDPGVGVTLAVGIANGLPRKKSAADRPWAAAPYCVDRS
jgi:hypothetical protein